MNDTYESCDALSAIYAFINFTEIIYFTEFEYFIESVYFTEFI